MVADAKGTAVATAVAAGLVDAYAELRQLQFLLQSLMDALMLLQPTKASGVICTPGFVKALQKVFIPHSFMQGIVVFQL